MMGNYHVRFGKELLALKHERKSNTMPWVGRLTSLIVTAHAFVMSTLSNTVATCDIDLQGSCLCVVGVIIFIISHTAFLPGLTEPNKTVCAVVGYSGVLRSNPHRLAEHWKAVLYGDVKKLDTHIVDEKEPRAPSGSVCPSSAELSSQLGTKNTVGIINDCIVLPAETSLNEGSNAQAPNQDTLGAASGSQAAPNQDNSGIQDVTASADNLPLTDKRARSQHSTASKGGKAGSVNRSTRKGEILETHLYKVVLSELNKYKDSNGKYNGIIRILDSKMLQTCYSLIKSNPGNMTPGTTDITLDGLNTEWFDKTAKVLIEGRFKFTPARQILIPKPNKPGQFRQILIANPREKIVQKALQVLLNTIFEPTFSKTSFGFRPGLSLVNALDKLHMRGGHMAWAINGDITKCFDSIPHQVIMNSIKEQITCVRTLTLIERGLKIGYVNEKGVIVKSKMGTPQGSILSPLLANIVLNKLDKFIESLDDSLNFGKKRQRSKAYQRLESLRAYYKVRNPQLANEKLKEMRKLSKYEMNDENYRRAIYVRYADDFVILLASTREFALELKAKIAQFLKENCGLELNDQKTTVTNTKKGFTFLGAFLKRRNNKSIFNSFKGRAGNKITRSSSLRMAVDAPIENLINKLIEHGFARRNHLSTVLAKSKTDMIHLTHFDIIRFYNSKITGLLTAFRFVGNFSALAKVVWILRQSCALTLARKFKLRTMKRAFTTFGFDLMDPDTGVKLNIPETFKATYNYETSGHEVVGNLTEAADQKLTKNLMGRKTYKGITN